MGTDPRVVVVIVVVALAIYGVDKTVHAAKKAEAKIVHVFHRK